MEFCRFRSDVQLVSCLFRSQRGADGRHGQLHNRGPRVGGWQQTGADRLHRGHAVRSGGMGRSCAGRGYRWVPLILYPLSAVIYLAFVSTMSPEYGTLTNLSECVVLSKSSGRACPDSLRATKLVEEFN